MLVTKAILEKPSGTVSFMAFDKGLGILVKSSPFDHFMQFIEGTTKLIFASVSSLLQTGQSIVEPAHEPFRIKLNGRFKILLTLIKSGDE